MRNRKTRRAGTGHKRSLGFGLREEPALEQREEDVFLKNRPLQIVHQLSPRKLLRGIHDPRQFSGIAPPFVRPRRRHPEWRLDQYQRQAARKIHRRHLLPSPATNGRALKNKKRHVRSQLRRKVRECFLFQSRLKKMVQPEQRRGGVAAASAQTSAMRDALFEMNFHSWRQLCVGKELLRRPYNEITVIAGNSRLAARERELSGLRLLDADLVRKCDGTHQRFDFVKSIGALFLDFQRKVDFGGGRQFHDFNLCKSPRHQKRKSLSRSMFPPGNPP